MSDPKADSAVKTVRREKMLETAWSIFSEKSIDSVTMEEIAEKANCGRKTLYRYFDTKPDLVVSVLAWKLEKFREENRERRPAADFKGMTAAEIYEFYLDSFLELYRNHKDILRFNQFFNVYVRSEKIGEKTLQPYKQLIENIKKQFHEMYLKAELDKTLSTDVPEQKMFSTTIHLMLAAVTRYAVGLIYIPESGFDAMEELAFQKELILKEYKMELK